MVHVSRAWIVYLHLKKYVLNWRESFLPLSVSQSPEDRIFSVSEKEAEDEGKLHPVSQKPECLKDTLTYSSVISCASGSEPALTAALNFALFAGFSIFSVGHVFIA